MFAKVRQEASMLFQNIQLVEEQLHRQVIDRVDAAIREIKLMIERNNGLFQKVSVSRFVIYIFFIWRQSQHLRGDKLTFLDTLQIKKIVRFQEVQSSILVNHYQDQIVRANDPIIE